MAEYVEWRDEAGISSLLVGRRVVEVDVSEGTLSLDNGVKISVEGISACCAFYDVTSLNTVNNIITAAWVEVDPHPEAEEKTFRIFVFADNEKINLATLDGSDGTGYYGTGFSLVVDRIWEV